MNSTEINKNLVGERQKQIAMWTAVIFAIIGLMFFLLSLYSLLILQKGRMDFSDKILTPVAFLMMVAGITGYLLIRRGHLQAGLWIAFGIILVPPVAAVSVFKNFYPTAIIYLVVFSMLSFVWIFPRPFRRPAILASVVALFAIIGFELWHPAYRISSLLLEGFAPYAIGVGGLALVGLLVWRAVTGNIRAKLSTAFMIIAVFSVLAAAFPANRYLVSTLTTSIGNNLNELARARSVDIGRTIDSEFKALKVLALNKVIQDAAAAASQGSPLGQAEIDQLDQQWRAADAANNNAEPLVAGVLNNPIASELRKFQAQFPQQVELFLTGVQGVSIASTNRTSDYLQSDEEWWQTAYRDGLYIGQPEYDDSSKTIAMNMAVTVLKNNQVVGVLRTTVNFTALTDTLIAGLFGETGRTCIYLPDGSELNLNATADGSYDLVQQEAPSDFQTLAQSTQRYLTITIDGVPTIASSTGMIMPGNTGADAEIINNLNWRVVTLQNQAEAQQPVNVQTRNITFLAIAIITVGAFVGRYLAYLISSPIIHLTATAEKIATGDLTARAKVESRDETGTLATTINTMTSRLQEILGSMEQRVAERTQSLELAADVGRSVSQVRALDVMLKDAAEIIRSRFDLYYTQVYMTDPTMTELVLKAGTGTVGVELLGRNHRLMLNTGSINGRAAVEKRSVVIPDTMISATFRPNPLLPDTRSEMAVPLMVGENVVGVLDLQSRTVGALSEDLLPAFEALAGQLAIAIQNAGLLAEAEQARAEVESQARRLVRASWSDYLDAIHKPERTGFVFEQNQVKPLEAEGETNVENAVNAPIEVTGEPIGSIVVEMEVEKQTAQNMELVNTIARQVAQRVESLRLLDSAERYRIEAEQAMQRVTREGWKTYMESGIGKLGYLYDRKEVVPVEADHRNGKNAVTLPIKVRDEEVGKLALMEIDRNDNPALELANAIAERLGMHIESLRQFDQTQSALIQTEQLSRQNQLILSAAGEGIFGIDVDGNHTFVNDVAANMLGYTVAELIGYHSHSMWHHSHADGSPYPAEECPIYASLHDGVVHKGDEYFLHKDGSGISVSFTSTPIREGDRVTGAVVTFIDITERKETEERIRRQAERESTLNMISQKIQSATTVEAVLQIAARELGHALGAPLTIAQLGIKE